MATITATEAARSFSEMLNRVRYRGEELLIVRGGEAVARLSAVPGPAPHLRELLAKLRRSRRGDSELANDLERIQAAQPRLERDPWAS